MKKLWQKHGGTILSVAGILVLVLLIGGFAISRGYLTRHVFNGKDISRDEYFQLVEPVRDTDKMLGCVPNMVLGLVVYEVQCFDTEAAVDAYLRQKHGTP